MLSTKPTVYCIDGSNLVRSAWGGSGEDDSDAMDFLAWLSGSAGTPALKSSCFRIVFDGSYRNLGSYNAREIMVSFSEGEKADDRLLEQSSFLKSEGVRVILVTSDRSLMDRAKSEGVKSIWCDAFISICRTALKSQSR